MQRERKRRFGVTPSSSPMGPLIDFVLPSADSQTGPNQTNDKSQQTLNFHNNNKQTGPFNNVARHFDEKFEASHHNSQANSYNTTIIRQFTNRPNTNPWINTTCSAVTPTLWTQLQQPSLNPAKANHECDHSQSISVHRSGEQFIFNKRGSTCWRDGRRRYHRPSGYFACSSVQATCSLLVRRQKPTPAYQVRKTPAWMQILFLLVYLFPVRQTSMCTRLSSW